MGYTKREATDEFRAWSSGYDRSILQLLLFRRSRAAMIRRITAAFGDAPIRALDVGCGTGQFAAELTQALPNARVVGVDLVGAMIHAGLPRWKAHAERTAAVQGDSERLPFETGSFDVVTCANSFHHYPHQRAAVVEMRRVLRPGGLFILIDGYRDAPYGWFIFDVCVAAVEGGVHHCSSARVRDLCRWAGLVDVRQKVHRGLAPFLLTEAVASTVAPPPHIHLEPTPVRSPIS